LAESENLVDLLRIAVVIDKAQPVRRLFIQTTVEELLTRLPLEAPTVWQLIQKFKIRYAWMGQPYFVGSPWSEYDICERLRARLRKDSKGDLRQIEETRKERLLCRDRVITDLARFYPEERVRDSAGSIDLFLYLRNRRMDAFSIAFNAAERLFSEIAARAGMSVSALVFLRAEEIYRLFTDHPPRAELAALVAKRCSGHAAQIRENSVEWYDPPGMSPEQAIPSGPVELLGIVANPGHVSGRVRIVMSPQDAALVAPGDILVTTMTLPSLVAGVERAGAIVTDEGGILCHAAIVSRELNIPCVIATKNGTKILRDGDWITVDAVSGRVTRGGE
jgi:phosphohistidine swiveling domain-containing protein